MNSNIIPINLRPHLVAFLLREMKGDTKIVGGSRIKTFDISRKTFIGKYLLDYLQKSDYPTKDIKDFNFHIEIKAAGRMKFDCKAKIFKREKMNNSFVSLPARHAEMVNELFEQQFRSAFYNFVESRAQGDELQITQSILDFIDKYDLYEAGLSYNSLRILYYKIKKNGICADIQGRLHR